MLISLVVAVADNGVIGQAGGLPWQLPDDLKHFRALTLGKSVLMGRRTFESIGRPLAGRNNLVMTRGAGAAALEGAQPVASLQEACMRAREHGGAEAELCVIGGAQIYALALPQAGRIHLTQVHALVRGDVCFPGYQSPAAPGGSLPGWLERQRRWHPPDARHAYGMSFVTLERPDGAPAV